MFTSPRSSLVGGILSLHLLLVGCSSEEPRRMAIGGAVAVNSSEVPEGSITFLPTDGHHGPAASTQITQGRYQFDASNGPLPGTYRVVVSVPPSRNPKSSQTEPAESAPSAEERLTPAKGSLITAPNKADPLGETTSTPDQWTTQITLDETNVLSGDFDF